MTSFHRFPLNSQFFSKNLHNACCFLCFCIHFCMERWSLPCQNWSTALLEIWVLHYTTASWLSDLKVQQTYQLELTLNLLSINDVKLSIRNGETSPSYHPICGCDTSPKNKKLKHQNHAWTHIRSGGTHSEHTLINLQKEYDVIIWVMLSSTKEYIREQSISVYNIHEKIMCIWLAETSASFM